MPAIAPAFPHPRARWRATSGAALVAVAAVRAPAAGQAAVFGVARDGLTGRPFAGATVQLVPADAASTTPRTADADSAGRFRFAGIAPGRYLLGFTHPRLDSIGVEVPPRRVEVASGVGEVTADVALPSAPAIVAALCGERRDTTGVVLGRVVDGETGGPVRAGRVTVRWAELRVSAADGVRRAIERVRAPVGEGGRYVACGVPTDAPLLIEATAGEAAPDSAPADSAARAAAYRPTARSGAVEFSFAPGVPLLYRDLYVGPLAAAPPAAIADAAVASGASVAAPPVRRGTARLTGVVRRPDGAPLAGARVVVRDAQAADSLAVTDAGGAFHFAGLPGGTYAVEAVAIGYAPTRAPADLRPGLPAALDLVLGRRVATLGKVAVYAAPLKANSEFARRRRTEGFGRFLVAADVERRSTRFVSEALQTVPGLRVAGATPNGVPILVGRGGCTPVAYLDGARIRPVPEDRGALPFEAWVQPSEVRGIEVYPDAVTAPAQYSPPGNSCAVVLVWTKARTQ